MRISASIVTYLTDYQELASCIDSLVENDIEKIYVVDNSPDSTIGTLINRFGSIEYIHNSDNIGYGAAHNIAIRRAIADGSEYHLVLNSDVWFEHGTIEPVTQYMESNPDVGQLIPNMVHPDGSMLYCVRMLPTPANLIFRRFMPKWFGNRLDKRYLLKFWDHTTPLDIAYHQGSFMFFRVSALKEVGLFDERFFMYPEDIDITRRMHRKYRTMFWPKVTVVHAHRAASYHSAKMLKIHIANMIRYFNKWGWFFDSERREFNRRTLATLASKQNPSAPYSHK